jgi:acetyltransferase
MGFPVALKIISPQITHKTEVGGVALSLASCAEVRNAAEALARRLRERAPGAALEGFSVQEMVRRPGAYETIVGATVDSVFGPVILFGQGGVAVEVIGDRAVALPPLNLALAEDLIARTRIARLLEGYRDHPPADRAALRLALTQVSQLIADLPEVIELDINPLLVDQRGVVALDARLKVAQATATGVERFAIRPYPKELEESVQLGGRSLLLRPIRPEDEPQHARFLAAVDAQDMHMRFFHAVRSFEHAALARLTQIDYDREMAFIAVERAGTGEQETLGVVRAIADPEGVTAEFAILVRSDLKGAGLGEVLMQKLIRYCRERGIAELVGEALTQNPRMLKLARALGFDVSLSPDTGTARMRLLLRDAQPAAAASPG